MPYNLPAGMQYRLHIFTQNGKEYASDYVPMKLTPAIDSVTYTATGSGKADDNGIQVYVNTHDATNATRYYRWEYYERWEYTSNYASLLEYKNYQVTSINPDSNRHYCYLFYTPPNGIFVSSSAYNIRAEKAFLKGDSIPIELIQPRAACRRVIPMRLKSV